MYCKHCGKIIDDNSIFCSFCGKPQKTQIEYNDKGQILTPKVKVRLENIFGLKLSKQVIGLYLGWLLLHFIFLIINWESGDSRDFWPFGKYSDFEDYDFTEFLIYTIVPLIGLIILNIFKHIHNKKVTSTNSVSSAYAGFGLRFLAYWIDFVIIFFISSIILIIIQYPIPDDAKGPFYLFGYAFFLVNNPFGLLLSWLYFALMESSNYQGTLGKLALKIKVTDMKGNKIGFGKASGRHFGKIVSGLILFIGYIMVAFTDKKQGLHDQMANCIVLRN